MPRISGAFIMFIIGITGFALIFSGNLFNRQYRMTEDTYKYALLAATRDATSVMIETKTEEAVNLGYEGYGVDSKDVSINFNEILERFYNTLWYNLGLYGDSVAQNAFKMHVPIKGIIGNQGVYIALWNDTWLPPVAYSYYDEKSQIIYNYTLGEDVWYDNKATGEQGFTKVSSVSAPEARKLTPEQWKQYVIMDTINKAFTDVASSELNLISRSQGKGISFILPHIENNKDNIIDHPGVFALLDGVIIGSRSQPLRTISFGGAQLREKVDAAPTAEP